MIELITEKPSKWFYGLFNPHRCHDICAVCLRNGPNRWTFNILMLCVRGGAVGESKFVGIVHSTLMWKIFVFEIDCACLHQHFIFLSEYSICASSWFDGNSTDWHIENWIILFIPIQPSTIFNVCPRHKQKQGCFDKYKFQITFQFAGPFQST